MEGIPYSKERFDVSLHIKVFCFLFKPQRISGFLIYVKQKLTKFPKVIPIVVIRIRIGLVYKTVKHKNTQWY